jgi:hypothetical protein
MKKITFLLFIVLIGLNLFAQDTTNNKHKKELYLSITKHNSWYEYYSIYQGYTGVSAGFGYALNERFQLVGEYNYGFMRNHNVRANASDHTINLGVNYKYLNKEKFNATIFAGTGIELIYLRTLVDDINFHYSSLGIPITIKTRVSYALNDKIYLFANAKTWYGFMDIDIEKGVFSKNDIRIFYYPSWFFSYGLGMSYEF